MLSRSYFLIFLFLPLLALSQNIFPSSGNVGIGTANPIANLHIDGSGKTVIFGDPKSANYPALKFFTGHSDGYNYIQSGGNTEGNIRITKFNTTNQNIDNFQVYASNTFFSGNLGIGQLSPKAKFHLKSNVVQNSSVDRYDANMIIEATSNTRNISEGAVLGFVVPASQNGTNPWQQGRIVVSPDNTLNNNAEGKMYLQTRYYNGNSTWKWRDNLVLKPNGNVGIGTLEPDSRLTVNGNIHTQEVKVDLNGVVAPDYVFDSNYRLLTLQQVQEFIDKHGHLPNVPSAKEMNKEGLHLKEMNLKLLEKVEELTLYTIEQHKEIMRLKKLEKRLEKIEELLQNTVLH
ncbi:hypothetical protein [Zunongwangia sp.]|uniref:hypothetical protein n=1 Tax=Zunongwangia sp. TaxID=1965325 RepID=UPI003AA989CF